MKSQSPVLKRASRGIGGETGGSHQFMLGLANFAFPHSPCNVNQSAGCQQGTGWRLAGDALLSCSFDPPSFTLPGFLGGHRKASTFFLLENETLFVLTSLSLSLLRLPSLCLISPQPAVTCQQRSGRLCLSLVLMSILITLDLAPHPPLPFSLP